MIKKITIEVINHLDQRYNTVGDWQFTRDEEGLATELNIKVSDIQETDGNMLIAIHELVEAILCELGGVKEKDVDQFDMNWVPRFVWWNSKDMISEPGEDDQSPYYIQHQTACAVERMVAMRLWTNWARYEAIVGALVKKSTEHFARKQGAVEAEFEGDPGPCAFYTANTLEGPCETCHHPKADHDDIML